MDEPQETTSPRRQLIELIVLVALVTAFVGVIIWITFSIRITLAM